MLAVDGLSFRYHRGAPEVFSGLTYSFKPGSVTAITGESGRGKSTLLYALGLLLRPTDGRVLINNQHANVGSDDRRSRLRARTIGFVFQDASLDPSRTVLDAVVEPALYAGLRRSEVVGRARALLESLGVEQRHEHRPGQISGGQAQRVAVCRSLINDPPILLADEPTGNLDRKNAAVVLDSLRWAAERRTVVIATHDPYVVTRADEVLEL